MRTRKKKLHNRFNLRGRHRENDGDTSYIPLMLMDYIGEHGLRTEGIFRVSGENEHISQIVRTLEKQEKYRAVDLTRYSIHSVAGALKHWFRMLPDPIMTYALYDSWLKAGEIENEKSRLIAIKKVVSMLPLQNRSLLQKLSELLVKVSDNHEENRMPAENLAIVFSPTLLRGPATLDPLTQVSDQAKGNIIIEAFIKSFACVFLAQFDKNDTQFAHKNELNRQETAFLLSLEAGSVKLARTLLVKQQLTSMSDLKSKFAETCPEKVAHNNSSEEEGHEHIDAITKRKMRQSAPPGQGVMDTKYIPPATDNNNNNSSNNNNNSSGSTNTVNSSGTPQESANNSSGLFPRNERPRRASHGDMPIKISPRQGSQSNISPRGGDVSLCLFPKGESLSTITHREDSQTKLSPRLLAHRTISVYDENIPHFTEEEIAKMSVHDRALVLQGQNPADHPAPISPRSHTVISDSESQAPPHVYTDEELTHMTVTEKALLLQGQNPADAALISPRKESHPHPPPPSATHIQVPSDRKLARMSVHEKAKMMEYLTHSGKESKKEGGEDVPALRDNPIISPRPATTAFPTSYLTSKLDRQISLVNASETDKDTARSILTKSNTSENRLQRENTYNQLLLNQLEHQPMRHTERSMLKQSRELRRKKLQRKLSVSSFSGSAILQACSRLHESGSSDAKNIDLRNLLLEGSDSPRRSSTLVRFPSSLDVDTIKREDKEKKVEKEGDDEEDDDDDDDSDDIVDSDDDSSTGSENLLDEEFAARGLKEELKGTVYSYKDPSDEDTATDTDVPMLDEKELVKGILSGNVETVEKYVRLFDYEECKKRLSNLQED